MARTTKADLQAKLDEVNAAFEQAHALLMSVSAQRDALERELANALDSLEVLRNDAAIMARAERHAAQQPAPAPVRRPALPNWQAERVAAMAQAKELAMRFGRTVKVAA